MSGTPAGPGLGAWLKLAAPLAMLALAGLVWVEPWLPGAEWIARHLGPTAVLRFAIGFGFLYLAMVMLEQRRLGTLFRQLLEELKRFRAARAAAGAGSEEDQAARLDAIRILISALGAPDAEVAANARKHLTRLCGRDLGADPAAWSTWLELESQRRRD
ncbi:MAG: hypothetical protein IT457_08590 [Planctomycetes bacterium]|nr:hypothetical protein [Planctomycetota bacterium]